jgi:hypothetical protein
MIEQNFITFSMDIIPLEANPNLYLLTSYNQKNQYDGEVAG